MHMLEGPGAMVDWWTVEGPGSMEVEKEEWGGGGGGGLSFFTL